MKQVIQPGSGESGLRVRDLPSLLEAGDLLVVNATRVLAARLRGRKTDSEDVIARRLADALGDMSHWTEFDHVIINDDLGTAVRQLEDVIAGKGSESRGDHPELAAKIKKILV